MQQITITGYLSRDAEMRATRNGDNIASWNVPVRQGFGDKEQTNWYRVSVWGKRAEYASKARKGDFVTVTGAFTIGEYEGKPQYEISATDFQSIRPAPRDDAPRPAPRDDAPRQQEPRNGGPGNRFTDDGDDIPFATRESIW